VIRHISVSEIIEERANVGCADIGSLENSVWAQLIVPRKTLAYIAEWWRMIEHDDRLTWIR